MARSLSHLATLGLIALVSVGAKCPRVPDQRCPFDRDACAADAGADQAAPPDAGTVGDGSADGAGPPDGAVDQTPSATCGNGTVEPGEDCEPPEPHYTPGSPTAIYCNSTCKETDACEECKSTCAGTSCDHFTGARRTACQAAERCFQENCLVPGFETDFELCYCGGVSHAACVTGGAVGVCRPEIQAAAETNDGTQIFNQTNADTPLGVALRLASCLSRQCGYPIGFPHGCGTVTGPPSCTGVDGTCQPADGTSIVNPRQAIDSCNARGLEPSWTTEATVLGATALWATEPSDAWLALSSAIRHFDGVEWATARYHRANEAFNSIWASGVSDFWFASTRFLTRWDGVRWVNVLPFGVDLVWGVGAGDVWATRRGRIFHWDGATISELPMPAGIDAAAARIWAMWGASHDDVWAFGTERINPTVALALHWDGTAWSRVDELSGLAFSNRAFLSAWGSAASDLWMSGQNYGSGSASELWHWDGVTWAVASGIPDGPIGALWGTARDDLWAVGGEHTATQAKLFHFDGSAWSPVTMGDRPLTLLTGSRRDDVWTWGWWGEGATLYHLHHACLDDSPPPAFTREPAPGGLADVVVGGPSNLWAISGSTQLQHWDGSNWTIASPLPTGDSPVINGIAGWPPNDIWAGGAHVTRLTLGNWIDVTPPGSTANLTHNVWGSGPNDVWVERGDIWMLHWDGNGWTQSDFGGANVYLNVRQLVSLSPTDAWAFGVNRNGVSLFAHWDGSRWTTFQYPELGRLSFLGAFAIAPRIWTLAINLDVFDTRILEFDGVSWKSVAAAPGYTGTGGVWASSPSNVWATMPQGDLWHYDGTTWSTVQLGADFLTGLAGIPTGEMWVAGVYLSRPVMYHHTP